MNQRVEIYDGDENGGLTFDLRDIVEVFPPKARRLEWYLLEFEAVGSGVLDIEKKINKRLNGIKFTWNELITLAKELTQTINAVLVGLPKRHPAPSLPVKPYDVDFIIVEAIDSSVWAVSSNGADVIEAIQKKFHDAKLVG